MIPWTDLAWTQVHQGHLPLWNPYNVLGTPLAFNWQSATFSVPALVGYLAPQRLDYTVQLVVTMVVGGTGAYVLGRVLRLTIPSVCSPGSPSNCAARSSAGWAGRWPRSCRGRAGCSLPPCWWSVAVTGPAPSSCFSVVLACAVYAGQPDTLVLLLLAVPCSPWSCSCVASRTRGSATGVRGLGDLGVASVAGLALSAPLLLPGLQLISRSPELHRVGLRQPGGDTVRADRAVAPARPHGWPVQWSRVYLGVVALILALVGVAFHRRRPGVVALIVVAARPRSPRSSRR